MSWAGGCALPRLWARRDPSREATKSTASLAIKPLGSQGPRWRYWKTPDGQPGGRRRQREALGRRARLVRVLEDTALPAEIAGTIALTAVSYLGFPTTAPTTKTASGGWREAGEPGFRLDRDVRDAPPSRPNAMYGTLRRGTRTSPGPVSGIAGPSIFQEHLLIEPFCLLGHRTGD